MHAILGFLNVLLSLVIGYALGFVAIMALTMSDARLSDAGNGAVSLGCMLLVVVLRWRRGHSAPASPQVG
jgi:hypothetical protein